MHQEIIRFWFDEIETSQWWVKDIEFDQLIARRFSAIHKKATQCELFSWRETAEGRLAEIIVLDQFSRNIYRDQPASFASDALALALSQEAIQQAADKAVPARKRCFLYMPYMHSESAIIHEAAVDLFTDLGQAANLEYELKHKAIIDRFGRYPHRNKIVGRDSTAEEIEFLTQPGSSF